MLVPPAWQNDPRARRRASRFHRYHAMLVEPWDGPAGLVFTDGASAARRSTATACVRCASPSPPTGSSPSASEAGAVPLPEGVAVRRARLGPGQLLSVDPERGLQFDGELKRELARRRPYGAWVAESIEQRLRRRAGAARRRAT